MGRTFGALRGLLIALVTAALGASVGVTAESAEAAPRDLWDPGFIITDGNFFANGSMTTHEIQSFLDEKVRTCNATSGPACLKSYRTDTRTVSAAEPGTCDAHTKKTNQTAAQVISIVARICGISERTLLVLLQKEQGLVTSTAPSESAYKYATGWGCPDTAPCQTTTVGLFNQLYKAAWQLKWYGNGSYTWIKVGQPNYVRYHPNASCGGTNVTIQNRATAALYYYTPYQPNAAALSNIYGTGDSCSTYGNRNFWRLWWDWFGSPTDSNSLFRATGIAGTFLISGERKYRVGSSPALDDVYPLGPVASMPKSRLQSFDTDGYLTGVVKNADASEWYLLDRAGKLPVEACSDAHDYAYTCGGASNLQSWQLDLFPTGHEVTRRVKTEAGHYYWVADGLRTEFYSTAAYASSGLPIVDLIYLADRTVAHIPLGPPVIPVEAAVTSLGAPDVFIHLPSGYWSIDVESYERMAWEDYYGEPKLMDPASLAHVDLAGEVTRIVRDDAGQAWLLSHVGRYELPDSHASGAIEIPDELLGHVPVLGELPDMPFFAETTAGMRFIDQGLSYRVASADDRARLDATLGPFPTIELSVSVEAIFPRAATVYPPGEVVRGPDGRYWYIDGATSRWKLDDSTSGELAASRPVGASAWALSRYQVAGALSLGVSCGGDPFVAADGKFHPLEPSLTAAFPFSFPELKASTCSGTSYADEIMGRFLRDEVDSQLYYVWGGDKRPISGGTYWRLRGGIPPNYVVVSRDFLSQFRTGSAIGSIWGSGDEDVAAELGVLCNGDPFVIADGTFYPLEPSLTAAFPFSFSELKASTCSGASYADETMGRFLRDASSSQLYYVWGGEKRPISGGTYWRLRDGTPPNYVEVGRDFLSHFITGSWIS